MNGLVVQLSVAGLLAALGCKGNSKPADLAGKQQPPPESVPPEHVAPEGTPPESSAPVDSDEPAGAPRTERIQVGARAPDFRLSDQAGNEVALADLVATHQVAVVFYRSAVW